MITKINPTIPLHEIDITGNISIEGLIYLNTIKNTTSNNHDDLFRGVPEVIFFKDGLTLEYKYDLTETEIMYFINLFFFNIIPEYKS